MPLLGGLLSNLFGGLVAWLAQYFTRKVAFGLATVAAYSTITLALYVAMRAALLALNSQVLALPEFWTMILGIAIPPAAPFCFSTYMTMWTACTVYVWQRDLLQIAIKA